MAKKYERALIDQNSPFALAESFKTIRTNMLYTGNNEKCPVFGVTSSDMEAGKSVFFANVSQAFAQLHKKVVLVDTDLRRPVQHKIFSLDNTEGVSEILAGLNTDLDKLIKHTHIENLDVITSGHIPPNPTELLASDNFKKLLNDLKQKYDVIFLDLPPIGVVIDALVITEMVTSYVVVVRCKKDRKQDISSIVSDMKQAKANIAGFVLNGVNPKISGTGHYRYYSRYGHRYYRHKYGYSATDKK